MLFTSILEGLYIIYMFNIFRTSKFIHHPFEQLLTNHEFLKHPISDSTYNNKICNFGKVSSYFLFIWLIVRFKIKKYNVRTKINYLIWSVVAIIAFIMNMNAFIYLLPILIIELFLIKYKIDNKN